MHSPMRKACKICFAGVRNYRIYRATVNRAIQTANCCIEMAVYNLNMISGNLNELLEKIKKFFRLRFKGILKKSPPTFSLLLLMTTHF